ncbi:MAG: hypothetical protein ABI169_16545, partial [Chitinophagaceae bacterium]
MLRRFTPYLYTLVGAAILLWPAIFNGFPILNNDDATYLASGFIPDTPMDRPITYGLLLRIGTLNGVSLWLAIALQAIMMSWIIRAVLKRIAGFSDKQTLVIIVLLAAFSPLAYVCSLLMPDIFTAVAVLCIALILVGNLTRGTKIGVYVLYTLAVAVHMSHVLMFSLLLLLLLVLKKWLLDDELRRGAFKRMVIMLLLTISTILIMGSALSKSKHVFFVGAMAKRGVLQAYLAEHCPSDSFRICAYRSEIVTNNNDFIWNPNSPLYKSGGWDANKEDFNRIIKGSITESRFIKMQIATSLVATGQQLLQFHMGDGNIPFGPETGLQQDVQQYLPKDIPRMNAAAQQQARLLPLLGKLNIVYDVLITISLLVFLV